MEWYYVAGMSVIFSLISVIYSSVMLTRAKENMSEDLDLFTKEIRSYNQTTLESLRKELDPVITNNKRAFSTMSTIGSQVKAEKAALAAFGEDIIDNNELMIAAIETVSPRFADQLRANPDQILTLMPRIQMIAQRLGLDMSEFGIPSPSSPNPSKPHPFGLYEE